MRGLDQTSCRFACLVTVALTAGTLMTAVRCGSAAAQTVRTIGPFNVKFYNNGQSNGYKTGTQDWTSLQMDDVAASIAAWSNRITNTTARPIELHLFWRNLDGDTLGETESPRGGSSGTSWTYTERAWRDGVGTTSPNGYDATITFDTSTAWNIGSQRGDSTNYDFRSTLVHEIGHTLGFVSSYGYGSPTTFWSQGLSAWDKKLQDDQGDKPNAGGTGTPGAFNVTDNPVWFNGANAKAMYGGQLVPVYAPTTYDSGSSLAHLDEARLPNALMSPSLTPAQVVRTANDLEWAIMKDLGWSIATAQTWSNGAGGLTWGTSANWDPAGLPSAASAITITNNGLADGDVINLGINRAAHSLVLDSNRRFTLGGSGASLAISSGNITRSAASSGTQTIASPLTLGANGVWDIEGNVDDPGKLILSAAVSGAHLYKLGYGTVELAGAMTLSGDLVLNNGDITLASGGSLTARKVYGDGTLNFDGGSLSLTTTGDLRLRGIRVGKEGSGSISLGPGNTLTGDVFVTVGRDNGAQGVLVNQSSKVTAGTNLFIGVYSGSRGVFLQQTDPAAGSPLPTTTVAAATCIGGDVFNDNGAVGLMELKSGTFTTQDLQIGPLGTATGGSATLTQTGGTLTVGRNLQIAMGMPGTYNLNGGTLVTGTLAKGTSTGAFNFGGGTLKAAATFATSMPLTLNAAGATFDTNGFTLTASGVLGGDGRLLKIGAGTLSLAAANTFTGDTVPRAGAVAVTNPSALQFSTLDLAAGDSGGVSFGSLTSATLGGLKGSRNFGLLAPFNLNVGANHQNTTYSGNLGGGMSVTKVGNGTLALTGSSAYTGGTIIAAGTLQVATPGNIGGGNINLAGGTLNLHSATVANLTTKSATLSGNSSIAVTGAGANLSHMLGPIAVTGNRTLTVTGSAGLTVGQVTANDSATIIHNAAGPLLFAGFQETAATAKTATFSGTGTIRIPGNITQSGASPLTLVKAGTGTLALSGTDTYTGGTQVLGGVLEIAAPRALPAGGRLSIGAGAQVVLADGLTQATGLAGTTLGEAAFPAAGMDASAATVPEPSTLALLICAAAALLGIRVTARRRRASGIAATAP